MLPNAAGARKVRIGDAGARQARDGARMWGHRTVGSAMSSNGVRVARGDGNGAGAYFGRLLDVGGCERREE